MKKKTFRKQSYTDEEQMCIERAVENEIILCFPPKEPPAGNFFNQMKNVLGWMPEIENMYTYQPVQTTEKEKRIGDISCFFMKNIPETVKGSRLAQYCVRRKIKRYASAMTSDCKIHEMDSEQDYPYSLRLYFIWDFFEHLNFGKRTRIGIIEGNAISRRDLIALIRQYYDRMNFLTIFSKEPAAYGELTEDAWKQYGLAVTVTGNLKELELCDYILDCTVLPFEGSMKCRKGCSLFSVCADQKKIRSVRKMGGNIRFDSCAANLDRAFHNKV
ncbi:MAG: hypothetical protein ACI4AA_07355 [Lachnospiraceae bacterium]